MQRNDSYSIEQIFEYMWAVERSPTVDIDSKPVEELVLELKHIENEVKKLAEDF